MLSYSTGPRNILDGTEFNRFFPFKPDHTDPIVHRDGTVEDAVEVMAQVAERYKADTALSAPFLQGKTVEETAENIWNFIHTYIQYREDQDGIEQIRRPLRAWTDRQHGIDCDCMSVFTSSILKNLNIPHYFRITKYGGPEFQHVYVIIPQTRMNGTRDYVVIDGVIDGFNKEKKFSAHKDFNINGMKIQTLNGPGDQSLYDYLVQTRNLIESNPETVQNKICPCDALPMFNMLIENWSDPVKRDRIIANNANVERQNFPNLSFFQTLQQYMSGMVTPQQVMQATYLGLSGIGVLPEGAYGPPDPTAEQWVVQSGADSGSGSGLDWWDNWGSDALTDIADILKTVSPSISPANNTNTQPYSLPSTLPATPAVAPPVSAAMGSGTILLTIGIIAGFGLLIWSMNDKPGKKLPA